MNDVHHYAFDYIIRAFPGDMVNVSIWRKSDEDMGGITLTSKTAGAFILLDMQLLIMIQTVGSKLNTNVWYLLR